MTVGIINMNQSSYKQTGNTVRYSSRIPIFDDRSG